MHAPGEVRIITYKEHARLCKLYPRSFVEDLTKPGAANAAIMTLLSTTANFYNDRIFFLNKNEFINPCGIGDTNKKSNNNPPRIVSIFYGFHNTSRGFHKWIP